MDSVSQDIVEATFKELLKLGQCQSRSDFSRNFLGREESYLRSVQSKGVVVSVEAQLNLATRLRSLGLNFSRSGHPSVYEIGATCLKLHAACLDDLLDRADTHA